MCRGPPHAWGVHAQPRGLWEQHGAAQHPAGPRCCYKPERLAAPPWTTGRPRLCHRGCPEGTVCLPGVHPTSAWLGFITGKWGCSAGDAPRGLRSGLRFAVCAHPWSLPLPLHPRGREAGVGVVRGEGPAPRGAWRGGQHLLVPEHAAVSCQQVQKWFGSPPATKGGDGGFVG